MLESRADFVAHTSVGLPRADVCAGFRRTGLSVRVAAEAQGPCFFLSWLRFTGALFCLRQKLGRATSLWNLVDFLPNLIFFVILYLTASRSIDDLGSRVPV